MQNQLRAYHRATITEALLKHGDKLTNMQAVLIREHYLERLSLQELCDRHPIYDENTLPFAIRRALELIELALEPLQLALLCERMRWALATDEKNILVAREDLENLLRALGAL